jgi:autotransporter translocation and assembly factor TamB
MNSKKWIVSFLMVLMSSACWSQVGIDVNVLAEKIILQLESSGALERAVQKIILQIKQQDIEAQIQEEQKKLTLQMEKAKLARSVDESTDFILGEKKAPLSIIIYSDF